MRTTLLRFTAVAALAVGAAGCSLLGDDSSDAPDEAGTEASAPAANAEDGDPSDGGGDPAEPESGSAEAAVPPDLSETVAASDIEVEGSAVTFEVKGVTASDTNATAHAVLTNTGDDSAHLGDKLFDSDLKPDGGDNAVGAASQINVMTITDASTGLVHSAAYTADGACLCFDPGTSLTLDAGESVHIWTQYAPLAEDATSVQLTFGPFGSFADVPVTRS